MTTLYKLSSNALLIWKGTINSNVLTIEHGQDGGKLQTETISYVTPEGANFDLKSRVNVKIARQGYSLTVPTTVPQQPMLASTYNPAKLPDLVYIQPKLDGIRCVGTRDYMCSRRNEPIQSMPHIRTELTNLPPGIRLDGELHSPDLSFQEHLSYIKRQDFHTKCHKIIYNVFDLQDDKIPFTERWAKLLDLFLHLNFSYIKLVPCHLVHKEHIESEIKFRYSNIEGCIIRDPQLAYSYNHRSSQLQKYKWTTTEECEIIDIIAAAKGREMGAAIFVCELDGVQFKVRPKFDLYTRIAMYHQRRSIIGRYTRVTYESLSDTGVPLKPRAEGYFASPTEGQ